MNFRPKSRRKEPLRRAFTFYALMRFHLQTEVAHNTIVWVARVPMEANIADIPPRMKSIIFWPSHAMTFSMHTFL